MANPNNFAPQMHLLRQAYQAELPKKLVQIEQGWQGLLRHWDAACLVNLHRIVHSLAGSGASYGFTRVSETARPLAIMLLALVENSAVSTALPRTEFDTLFSALQEAANQPNSLVGNEVTPQPHLGLDGVAKDGAAKSDALSAQAGAGLEGKTYVVSQELIFLLSDDAALCRELAFQLSCFGYQTRTFGHFEELEKAMSEMSPAAMILDIVTSAGNAISGAEMSRLKGRSPLPMPLLFVSSRSDITTRLQAARAGGDAYFTKPVDIGELIDKLDTLTAEQTPEPYHILIVEDDTALADYYTITLQAAGMVSAAITDPLQVLHALSEFRPDLILMDVCMPACTGAELATVIRQQEDFVSIPIVFLSAETDLDKQMAVMSQGGDDFLTKPIKPDYLVSSVTSRAHRSRILRSLMVRDSLTGLLNHTATKEQLDIALARARRSDAQLTFAMIDIDRFKSVNDTYGHAVGDRVIKSLSRLLQQRLRKTDIVGRYGGEEFAAVLVDTDEAAALKVLEEVRLQFSQIRHISEAEPFVVTLSCGVATAPPWLNATELVDAADKALYDAKRGGRNRVITHERIAVAAS